MGVRVDVYRPSFRGIVRYDYWAFQLVAGWGVVTVTFAFVAALASAGSGRWPVFLLPIIAYTVWVAVVAVRATLRVRGSQPRVVNVLRAEVDDTLFLGKHLHLVVDAGQGPESEPIELARTLRHDYHNEPSPRMTVYTDPSDPARFYTCEMVDQVPAESWSRVVRRRRTVALLLLVLVPLLVWFWLPGFIDRRFAPRYATPIFLDIAVLDEHAPTLAQTREWLSGLERHGGVVPSELEFLRRIDRSLTYLQEDLDIQVSAAQSELEYNLRQLEEEQTGGRAEWYDEQNTELRRQIEELTERARSIGLAGAAVHRAVTSAAEAWEAATAGERAASYREHLSARLAGELGVRER